jgi:ssDNA-binding Zn-finger/Zn-ribbon topoisomerase 1
MRRNELARAVHHKRSLKQVWQLGDFAGCSNFPRCQDSRLRTTVDPTHAPRRPEGMLDGWETSRPGKGREEQGRRML